ncbi:DUF6719 family protein [Labrys sp. WJW]|uniref:DUF6719 family protein n=1 Tax=Labrys sp. WJW TaxID=1737983 RepID=UPI003528F62A
MVAGIGAADLAWARSKLVQSQILTEEPPKGTLRAGMKVLVDDGTCGAGKIKRITGGNGSDIPRKRECVSRPK